MIQTKLKRFKSLFKKKLIDIKKKLKIKRKNKNKIKKQEEQNLEL